MLCSRRWEWIRERNILTQSGQSPTLECNTKSSILAIRNLEEIKRERFSEYIHHGIAIPEPQRHEDQYSGKFVLRIPKYLHRELASAARENDVSLNQFLVSLLAAGVEKHKCL